MTYTAQEVVDAVNEVRENADELAYESDDVLSMKIGAAHVLGHLPNK
jgi:hypothetical protein